jgi:hypothetical protein
MKSGISGLAVFYATAGGILLWSGLKGQTIKETISAVTSSNSSALSQPGSETVGTPSLSINKPTAGATAASSGTVTAAGGNPASASAKANQATGKLMASAYGWGSGAEWTALNNLVMSESGWNNKAQNPGSTAYGIGQFLDTTWAGVGYTKTSDPITQIAAMLAYIKQRYGDPVKAWAFHQANNYY